MALFGGSMPPAPGGPGGPGGPGIPGPGPVPGGAEVAECGAINCINNTNGTCRLDEITVSSDGRCVDYEPGGSEMPPGGGPARRPTAPPPPAAPRLGM